LRVVCAPIRLYPFTSRHVLLCADAHADVRAELLAPSFLAAVAAGVAAPFTTL
jgi:hypothetical protein